MRQIGPDRIRCLVPGCGRTAKRLTDEGEHMEIICGKHFRLSDKHQRRRYAKLYKIAMSGRAGSEKAYDLAEHIWPIIKRQAIERAMGITA